jgi:hypothetical protein
MPSSSLAVAAAVAVAVAEQMTQSLAVALHCLH